MDFSKNNETHLYVAYKRFTSDVRMHTDWKWKDEKRYSMQMETKKKARVAILLSDKIDFKWQRRSLHNNKGVNPQENIPFVNISAPSKGPCKY